MKVGAGRLAAVRVHDAGDKGYDTRDFVAMLRSMRTTPHLAQYTESVHRRSAIDARTTRHPSYAVSQEAQVDRTRLRLMKTVGGLRKLRHRGGPLVDPSGEWLRSCNWPPSHCRPRIERTIGITISAAC